MAWNRAKSKTLHAKQVLEAALERLGAKPIVHRMNPKAMPRQQLLGSLNLDTREWADGVLTAAARKVCGILPSRYTPTHDKSKASQLATPVCGGQVSMPSTYGV